MAFTVTAQDTLKVMQYNVLRYGDANCDKTNEDDHFKAIIDYYEPDILAINELEPNEAYAEAILARVLNTNNRTGYKRAQMTNKANSGIVNMLFYNSNKLALKGQDVSNTILRDINHYRLFYKAKGLGSDVLDTAFFNISSMHLKAGDDQNDEQTRDQMTMNMMNHINQKGRKGHYFATGDFNIQGSNDDGYQNFVNPEPGAFVDFVDPIDQPGNWHKNSNYADHHSQSTRTDYIGDCGVPGGLDDRFDFILLSEKTMDQEAQITYLNGSYNTGGQDGQRFDQSVLNPENQSVSSSLANSMKQMSDHLPVMLDVVVDQDQGNSTKILDESNEVIQIGPNPFEEHLTLTIPPKLQAKAVLSHVSGRKTLEKTGLDGKTILHTDHLKPGIYILKVFFANRPVVYRKLIKK